MEVIQGMVIVSMEAIIINHTIKKVQVIVQELLIMQSVWVHMVTITIINLLSININISMASKNITSNIPDITGGSGSNVTSSIT